jgi:hypothetical protein
VSSSYFFSNVIKNDRTEKIIDYLEKYAASNHLQVYLIDRPLGENKYVYTQKEIIVLLIPKSKMNNCGANPAVSTKFSVI